MTVPPQGKKPLVWEELVSSDLLIRDAPRVLRCAVPGGWLVWAHTAHGDGLTFVPDPGHGWDGSSAP